MNPLKLILETLIIGVIVIFPHYSPIPLMGFSIPILLMVWLYLKYTNSSFAEIGFSFKGFKWHALAVGSLVAILTLAFMQLIFHPALDYFIDFPATDFKLYDQLRESMGQLIFLIILSWIVGGFYEEIVFHGFIFNRVEKHLPSKYGTLLAFIISASLFGVYHVQLGPDGLINAFLVGAVYLGLFLYFKRNLWYPIICHGMHNSLVMILIYLGYI